jgi:hypothetical protein
MTFDPAPFQILHVSELAPGWDFGAFKDIGTAVRQHSRDHDLTGALLFNGERICQLIEGPEAHVRALLAVSQDDPRHARLRVLFDGVSGGRLTRRLAVGYCEPNDLDPLVARSGLLGIAALGAFALLLDRADVD